MAIVYILSNPSFPDWYKIGVTNDLDARVKKLSQSTSIPLPFECFFACEVSDAKNIEKKIHEIFSANRVSSKREFFKVDPFMVKKVLELVSEKQVDISSNQFDKHALEENDLEIELQSQFSFAGVGIGLGESIVFSEDESVIAKVFDQDKVRYQEKIWDFSDLTKNLLKQKYGSSRLKIAAPRFWTYDNVPLVARKAIPITPSEPQ